MMNTSHTRTEVDKQITAALFKSFGLVYPGQHEFTYVQSESQSQCWETVHRSQNVHAVPPPSVVKVTTDHPVTARVTV